MVQRVSRASVRVDGETVGSIGQGLCLLVGIAPDDGEPEVDAAVNKIVNLRVFADAHGKMNRSLADVEGGILLVSQFTLLGDARKGRRPSFTGAADPDLAASLIELMAARFAEQGVQTAEGVFGANMEVDLVNDGPVTLILELTDGRVV